MFPLKHRSDQFVPIFLKVIYLGSHIYFWVALSFRERVILVGYWCEFLHRSLLCLSTGICFHVCPTYEQFLTQKPEFLFKHICESVIATVIFCCLVSKSCPMLCNRSEFPAMTYSVIPKNSHPLSLCSSHINVVLAIF